MKQLLLLCALCLLPLAGGCSTKTLGPEEFLYVYRCGSLPGEPPGRSSAAYTGRDDKFHHIRVKGVTPSETLISGSMGDRKYRCVVAALPKDFPRGFQPLAGPEGFEASNDTREYVQKYLGESKLKEAREGAPRTMRPDETDPLRE